jgi:hypothetical protein
MTMDTDDPMIRADILRTASWMAQHISTGVYVRGVYERIPEPEYCTQDHGDNRCRCQPSAEQLDAYHAKADAIALDLTQRRERSEIDRTLRIAELLVAWVAGDLPAGGLADTDLDAALKDWRS